MGSDPTVAERLYQSKTDCSKVTPVNHMSGTMGQTTSRDLCQHTLCTLVW